MNPHHCRSKWFHRWFLSTAALFQPFATVCLAAVPPTSLEPPPPASFRVYGEIETVFGGRVFVAMPRAINSRDLDRWSAALALNSAAASTLRETVEQFYPTRLPSIRAIVLPVDDLSHELFLRCEAQFHNCPDAPEAFRELIALRNRAASRLWAIDEELFTAIASAIAPDDSGSCTSVVRELWRRSRYDTAPCDLPLARVDLRTIMTALTAQAPFVLSDSDAWSAAWNSHDAELARLEERRVRLQNKTTADAMENYRDSGRNAQLHLEYKTRSNGERLAVERAIIAANDRWEDAFANAMSLDDAKRWKEAIRAAEHPQLFPNPLDITSLIAALRGASEHDESLRANAQALAIEGDGLALAESAALRALDELAVSEARGFVGRESRSRMAAQIDRLQAQRCAAAARAIELCAASVEIREGESVKQLSASVQKHCTAPSAALPAVTDP